MKQLLSLLALLFFASPALAETQNCDLGDEIVDLISQADCFQGANAAACALGALGITYSSQKSRIGSIGLGNRPGFAKALASDPAAQQFVKGIEAVLKTHAAEFRSYIAEVRRSGPFSKKLKLPTLQDKIAGFKTQNKTTLAKSPAAAQVWEWTQYRSAVELTVKHRLMLEAHKTSLEQEKSKIKDGPKKRIQLQALEAQIRESNRAIALWESREGLRQTDVKKIEQTLKQKAQKNRIVKGAKVGALAVGAMAAGQAAASKLNSDKLAKCFPQLSPADLEILKDDLSFGAGVSGSCDSLQFDPEQLLSILNKSIDSKTPASPALCTTLQKSKEAAEKRFLAEVDLLDLPNCSSGEVQAKVGDKKVQYWIKEEGKNLSVESEFIRGSNKPENRMTFKLNDRLEIGRPEVLTSQWNSQIEGSSSIDNATLIRSYLSSCRNMKELIESDLQASALPQQQRCAVGRSLLAIQHTYPLAKLLCDLNHGSARVLPSDSAPTQKGGAN